MSLRVLPLSIALAACPGPMLPVDAGQPVDAGPPREVDGGLVGPFARGELLVSQSVREVGVRRLFTSQLTASFLEVPAPTPSPCLERREGRCAVRVCNLSGAVVALPRSAGTITFWGLLALERDGGVDGGLDGGADGGALDAGLDGGWTITTNDAGLAALTVSQRLFFTDDELSASVTGADLPAFTTPTVRAPGQLTLSKPRCVPGCPSVARDVPFELAWSGVSLGEVVTQLTTPQVSISCTVPASEATLTIPVSLLSELTPSIVSGEATLLVKTRSSVQFDAGGFELSFAAETPTLFPITVLP